ncbi:MAG: hypothetical protein NZ898_06650 [Myxococcota bacterium]|nr:hypothetical protein [Myxococcota bacterium]
MPSIELTRAWVQFLVPVGQIRLGRMPSHWGLGILVTGGGSASPLVNGQTAGAITDPPVGEWGDTLIGTTSDRILFATRPLTVYNALTRQDARPTPLILGIAYDKLVEDRLAYPPGVEEGPIGDPPPPSFRRESGSPFSFLAAGADDVQQTIGLAVWNDPDFNARNAAADELSVGLYYVNRTQEATASDVHIFDGYWRLRWSPSPTMPSLYTAGEVLNIRGRSRGLVLAGGCGSRTNPVALCNEMKADIWGAVARLGAIDRQDHWAATVEWGHSSGDPDYFGGELTARPLHPDYRVGLLMYPVVMAVRTSTLGEPLRPLWSRGGVWNSSYLYSQLRYQIIPGIQVHGAFLVAWADELLGTIYVNQRDDASTECGMFQGDCGLGWEADLALRVRWGENDVMRWDTELGLMGAGPALYADDAAARATVGGLSEPLLWTIQTRAAMVW